MKFRCPVCAYAALPYPPRDYHICLCCGTEFGNDDARFTHAQLREMWVAVGARWFFGNPLQYWNPWLQLIEAKYFDVVPRYLTQTSVTATVPEEGPLFDFSNQPWAKTVAA